MEIQWMLIDIAGIMAYSCGIIELMATLVDMDTGGVNWDQNRNLGVGFHWIPAINDWVA